MDTPTNDAHFTQDGVEMLLIDSAWVAGFLCALGTFTLHEGRPLLIVKSSRDRDSVARFARVIHSNANVCVINGKPGLRVTVSGERLHKVMRAVWSQLTPTRKRDYLAIRRRARDFAESMEEEARAA
jgi:hypothetical protein